MPPGGVLFLLRGLRNSGFNHKHIIDCTVLCSNFCHSNILIIRRMHYIQIAFYAICRSEFHCRRSISCIQALRHITASYGRNCLIISSS